MSEWADFTSNIPGNSFSATITLSAYKDAINAAYKQGYKMGENAYKLKTDYALGYDDGYKVGYIDGYDDCTLAHDDDLR